MARRSASYEDDWGEYEPPKKKNQSKRKQRQAREQEKRLTIEGQSDRKNPRKKQRVHYL